MNQFFAKHFVYYPVQYIRGQIVWKHMREVQHLQFKSPAQINDIRNEKLKALVHEAYRNIPYYKNKFNALGLKPEEIRSSADLSRIPVLSKRDVLANTNTLLNTNFTKKLHTRKTGGSTGMTLHFKKEARALSMNEAIMYRCYSWYGINIGDKQLRFWGVPVIRKQRYKEQIKDFVLNRISLSVFDISESSCVKQYKRIRKFKPAYIYGYTTAIYGFCLYMQKKGIRLDDLNLKALICTSEKMYPHHRKLFEEIFNCPVVDEYGSSENGIIAFQCSEGNMHMMSDHMCIEFLDENDQPVKTGELGRIVITDLSCYGMPLIRYDIGDMGKPTDLQCRCGVHLPLMEVVEGRKEDFIKTKEGKLIHPSYLSYTLEGESVHESKMYQKDIDQFHVQIVKSPLFTEKTEVELTQKLRTELGSEINIHFEYLDRIPRDKSGKLRAFVSELSGV
jgi:phenylacetate-coenzyme A ligase PaaK-like adenylate-forming protein